MNSHLDNNMLENRIPSSIGNLSSLRELYLFIYILIKHLKFIILTYFNDII